MVKPRFMRSAAFIAGGVACTVVLSGCSPFFLSPRQSEFANARAALNDLCATDPDSSQIERTRQHAWFTNAATPTLDLFDKSVKQLTTACEALDTEIPFWIGQETVDALDEAVDSAEIAVGDIEAANDDAEAYLDFSLATQQLSFTYAALRIQSRGMTDTVSVALEKLDAIDALFVRIQAAVNYEESTAADLKNLTESAHSLTADVHDFLATDEYMSPAQLASLLPDALDIDDEIITGKIPVLNHETLPQVTKSVAEIAANPPRKISYVEFVHADKDDKESWHFTYASPLGEIATFTPTNDPSDILYPTEGTFEKRFSRFYGWRNLICQPSPSVICWAQTSDGDWWKTELKQRQSSVFNPTILFDFLDNIDSTE